MPRQVSFKFPAALAEGLRRVLSARGMTPRDLADKLDVSLSYALRLLKGHQPGIGREKANRVRTLLRGLPGEHEELVAWAVVGPEAVSAAHRRQAKLAQALHRYGFMLCPDDQPVLFASALGTAGSVRILRTESSATTPAALYERLLATPLCRSRIEGFERWAKELGGGTAEAQVRGRLAVCHAIEAFALEAQMNAEEWAAEPLEESPARTAERALEAVVRDASVAPLLEAALSVQRALIEQECATRRHAASAAGNLGLVVNHAGKVTAFVAGAESAPTVDHPLGARAPAGQRHGTTNPSRAPTVPPTSRTPTDGP